MKAYSQDLRERVLRAVDQGRPRAEIMQLSGVSLATIKRYLKQRRDDGHLKAQRDPWPNAEEAVDAGERTGGATAHPR